MYSMALQSPMASYGSNINSLAQHYGKQSRQHEYGDNGKDLLGWCACVHMCARG